MTNKDNWTERDLEEAYVNGFMHGKTARKATINDGFEEWLTSAKLKQKWGTPQQEKAK